MDLRLNYYDFSGVDLSLTFPDNHAAKVSRVLNGNMGSMTGMVAASATD